MTLTAGMLSISLMLLIRVLGKVFSKPYLFSSLLLTFPQEVITKFVFGLIPGLALCPSLIVSLVFSVFPPYQVTLSRASYPRTLLGTFTFVGILENQKMEKLIFFLTLLHNIHINPFRLDSRIGPPPHLVFSLFPPFSPPSPRLRDLSSPINRFGFLEFLQTFKRFYGK